MGNGEIQATQKDGASDRSAVEREHGTCPGEQAIEDAKQIRALPSAWVQTQAAHFALGLSPGKVRLCRGRFFQFRLPAHKRCFVSKGFDMTQFKLLPLRMRQKFEQIGPAFLRGSR